eukprot:4594746-Pleurochrysis_carterae.AAC.4
MTVAEEMRLQAATHTELGPAQWWSSEDTKAPIELVAGDDTVTTMTSTHARSNNASCVQCDAASE